MIIPTLPILIFSVVARNVYGEPVHSPVGRREKCSPVRMSFAQQGSTVRTDSGASHGHAQEDDHAITMLVLPGSAAAVMDSIIEVLGHRVRVNKVHPRYTATGRLDHYHLECGPWA